MNAEQEERLRQGDELYERYGKPLESEHWGEYIVIMPDGRSVLGKTLLDTLHKAVETLGRGTFLFKLGEKAVYKLR